MGDKSADPIDHHRTTRANAGVSMKNDAATPGLVFVLFGVVAFVGCLAALASRHYGAAVVCSGIAAVAAAVATGWLYAQRRRVRNIKHQWLSEHPDALPAPPDS